MPDFDIQNDIVPAQTIKNFATKYPTVAALKAAIAGSGVAASYPAAMTQKLTRNDLIYICKLHSITVVGI